MKINLISGALGAEISGLDLKDSSEENWNVINQLLLEHKVLFFRNQNISPPPTSIISITRRNDDIVVK